MKVSVALRVKFHGFQLAQQLQNRNALNKLYTSYYGRFLGRANNTGYKIERYRVETNFISALLTYGIKLKDQLKNYDYFGNWVAKKIGQEDIIVSWGLSALPVIKRAKELGIVPIVERGSSHVNYQKDILIEEYKMFGADTTELERSFNVERVEREIEEYNLAEYISIPSSFVERTFIENGIPKEKLIITPYGVNLNEFKIAIQKPDKFRIIYVGAMALQKGVHYLLKAFSELKLPNAELWLVGGILPEIKPFFIKYEGSFKHFNPVPQEKLVEYYNKCSSFIICSIQDGLAMVRAQAMACGLPVICTTNTGGEDLIEDGKEGFVIPIRDVNAIKEKIEFLYYNRDKCAGMGEMARRKVESGFTWDDYGEKIYSKYQHILDFIKTGG